MEIYNKEGSNAYIIKKYEKALVVVKEIFDIAHSLGYNLYFAGGFVRDMFLEKKTFDMDLVLEGDTLELFELLKKKTEHKLVFHERFGVISFEYLAYNFDIAMTRTEIYEKPGALPIVKFTNLSDDVHRRDFTINAMYLKIDYIDENLTTELISPLSGLLDLKNKKIKVLHELSFYEDPTRLIRAVRYKTRLGFDYEYWTKDLIESAVRNNYMGNITGDRLLFELEKALGEDHVLEVIDDLIRFGLLNRLKINRKLDKIMYVLIKNYMKNDHWKKHFSNRSCGIICILSMFSDEAKEAFLEEIVLSKKIRKIISDMSTLRENINLLEEGLSLGEIYELTFGCGPTYKYFLEISSEETMSKLEEIEQFIKRNPLESSWNDFEDASIPKEKWKSTLILLQKQKLNGIILEYKDEIGYLNKIKTGDIDV